MSNEAENSSTFRTIKSLVFDYVHRLSGNVDYDALTAEVQRHFPGSAWKKSHWAWYKSQIIGGQFSGMFSDAEKALLKNGKTSDKGSLPASISVPPIAKTMRRSFIADDPTIKQIGDEILRHVRVVVDLAARDDETKRFKLNRWVFSRLLQEEIRVKRPIKKHLWESGQRSCQACKQPFPSLKGVEIHRRDASKGYSVENCELLCRECHQEIDRPSTI